MFPGGGRLSYAQPWGRIWQGDADELSEAPRPVFLREREKRKMMARRTKERHACQAWRFSQEREEGPGTGKEDVPSP